MKRLLSFIVQVMAVAAALFLYLQLIPALIFNLLGIPF